MFFKKMLPAVLVALSAQSSLFGFTIINQTNSEKVLVIQEAYRPNNDPGKYPLPLGFSPYEVAIPPNSIYTFSLRERCPVLLVSVVMTKVVKKDDGECTSTSRSTTCYEPYSYQGKFETDITDDWGIVIYKPITNQKPIPFYDPYYAHRTFQARQNLQQGYGIKCLHPGLLEKVTSLEELPEELTN